MVKYLAIACAVLVSACASTPPAQMPIAGPVPADKARLTILRSTDFMYFGAPASVDVNGLRVAQLWRGESVSTVVAPGQTTVSTDAWSAPGRYTITFTTEPGTDYMLGVSPRGTSFAAGMAGGVIGMGVDAAVNQNSGAFQVTVTDARKAP